MGSAKGVRRSSARARRRRFVLLACALAVSAAASSRLAPAGAQGSPDVVWSSSSAALNSAVRAVAFAPDGRTIATGHANNTTTLWRASDGAQFTTLTGCRFNGSTGVTSVAYAPDSQALAAATECDTKILGIMYLTNPKFFSIFVP